MRVKPSPFSAGVFCLALAVATFSFAASSSQVTPVGNTLAPRVGHTATALTDGRALIVGGADGSGTLASAELFDPASGTFSTTGPLNSPRRSHTATLLPDGRVLIAGGSDANGPLDSAELYDPATGLFTAAASLSVARSGHTAIMLGNGLVLIAGGDAAGTAELFDPVTQSFGSLLSRLTAIRSGHGASLLPDGLVFIAGGTDGSGSTLDSCEAYDPDSQTFVPLPYPMYSARSGLANAVTADGDVLMVGGDTTGTIELFRPEDETFSLLDLTLGAAEGTATRLANNKVLVIGKSVAAIYDPAANQFEPFGGSTNLQRQAHSAISLPGDGKVLVSHGKDGDGAYLSAASLFNPARIRTDQDDYPPFSFVDITGSGFLPGETVSNQVAYVAGPLGEAIYDPWGVAADTNGGFLTTWLVFSEDLVGATLELTATSRRISSVQRSN